MAHGKPLPRSLHAHDRFQKRLNRLPAEETSARRALPIRCF